MISELAEEKGVELESALLKRLDQKLVPLTTTRDLLAHGLWVTDGSDWFVQNTKGSWTPPISGEKRTKTSRKLLPQGRQFNTTMLQAVLQDVNSAIEDARGLLRQIQLAQSKT